MRGAAGPCAGKAARRAARGGELHRRLGAHHLRRGRDRSRRDRGADPSRGLSRAGRGAGSAPGGGGCGQDCRCSGRAARGVRRQGCGRAGGRHAHSAPLAHRRGRARPCRCLCGRGLRCHARRAARRQRGSGARKAHGPAQNARDFGLLYGASHARDASEAAVPGRNGAAVWPRAVFLQECVEGSAQPHVRHGFPRLALVHAHLSLQRLRDVHAAPQLQALLCVRRGAALAHPLRQVYGAGRGRGGQLRHPQAHAPAAAHGHGPTRGHVCRAAGRPDRGARPGAHPPRRARAGRRDDRQRPVRGRRVHAHRREHAGGQGPRRQGHRRQLKPLRLCHRLGRGAGQGVRARADHSDRAAGPVRKSTRAALCRQGRALVRAGRHRRGGADVSRLVPAHCAAQSRARAAHLLRRAVGRVPVRARPRHTDGAHGRLRPRGGARHPLQERCGARKRLQGRLRRL